MASAIKAAEASAFVETLAAEKHLGERGSTLSGGQRQRPPVRKER